MVIKKYVHFQSTNIMEEGYPCSTARKLKFQNHIVEKTKINKVYY